MVNLAWALVFIIFNLCYFIRGQLKELYLAWSLTIVLFMAIKIMAFLQCNFDCCHFSINFIYCGYCWLPKVSLVHILVLKKQTQFYYYIL